MIDERHNNAVSGYHLVSSPATIDHTGNGGGGNDTRDNRPNRVRGPQVTLRRRAPAATNRKATHRPLVRVAGFAEPIASRDETSRSSH